jgi:hypothetical protein
MRHVGVEIIEQRLPVGEHRAAATGLRSRRRAAASAILSAAIAVSLRPIDAGEGGGVRPEQPADPAELGQQLARQRLGVAAWNGERQQIFDQLMIKERLRPALEQPFAQAGAVARRVFPDRVHGGDHIGRRGW